MHPVGRLECDLYDQRTTGNQKADNQDNENCGPVARVEDRIIKIATRTTRRNISDTP